VLDGDLGARLVEGGTTFTVWAPRQQAMSVALDGGGEYEMEPAGAGYFRRHVPGVGAGQRYWYVIAEGRRPDPASRFQPDGVWGPSMVVNPSAFAWTDAAWPGAAPAHEQVIYELHVGTFTRGGTWTSARERLPDLAALGIRTLEVMPIAEFDGRFGWGYDGVFLFAPYHGYGAPDDVRGFVDAAHACGLAVILDVVYNHIGPAGSVLHEFSAVYFSDHESDWGRGFNLDGPQSDHVRRFFRANARAWLEDYHFDGLRFDAVHAIVDRSPEHLILELTGAARAARAPRRTYMVGENESQDVSLLARDGAASGLDGIWNEDWHHAAFVALTGRREAYFTDYTGAAHEFASMARWNLLYQGQWYTWQKQRRGTDARHVPGSAFVSFLENHDQVANTGSGSRLHRVVDQGMWRAMTALLLLGPGVPMLFQGQERAVTAPFTYFADHEGDLGESVRVGRQSFLAQFQDLRDAEVRRLLPDPGDESAYRRCQIDWQETREGLRAWQLHRDLLALRRDDPVLARVGTGALAVASSAPATHVLVVRYQMGEDERLLLVNLGLLTVLSMNDPLLAEPSGQVWSLVWCSEAVQYGGFGVAEAFGDGAWRLQAHCAWLLRSARAEARIA
jgi:maltooligosyltrehalose trehalohydrolase